MSKQRICHRPVNQPLSCSSFVDWIGIDAYNWGDITEQNGTGHSWHFFADLFNLTYSDLTTDVAPGKPLMIVETASNTISNAGYTKPQWITDAFTTQLLQHFPHVNAIIWFDQNNATDNQGRANGFPNCDSCCVISSEPVSELDWIAYIASIVCSCAVEKEIRSIIP